MFKVNNKDTRTTPVSFWLSLLLTLNIFHTFVLVFLLLTLNMQLSAGMAQRKIYDLFSNSDNLSNYEECYFIDISQIAGLEYETSALKRLETSDKTSKKY